MGDFLASFYVLSGDTVVAIGISVVGILISLIGFLRIRTVSKAIQRERELMEAVLEFPEIQFHLESAKQFLALSRQQVGDEREPRERLRDGLQKACHLIGSFHRQYLGRRAVGNPYLFAAKRYQKRGAIDDAIFWYERALQTSTEFGIGLSREETRQCLVGLQKCYFMCFDPAQAKSIARRAAEVEAPGCRTEREIRQRGWLLCIAASIELVWRRSRHPIWSKTRSFPVVTTRD